jgi:NADH-quinone oxidoreductase subunit G
LIVPAHHIFGSEELSVLSPGIVERSPEPYLGLGHEDAEALKVSERARVRLTMDDIEFTLPVRLAPTLERGVAALPVGLGELETISLPGWGRVRVERNE